MSHKCTWILRACKPGAPAVYCEKPIRTWTMERDDEGGDGLFHRKYPSLCPEHQKLADTQSDEDEPFNEETGI